MDTVAVDCLILGGGLSGLWMLNVLRRAGYSALLIHDGPELGGAQTLNCGGMILGGRRLDPARGRSDAPRAGALPGLWDDCLRGSGRLDLREVRILSPEQTLWCPGDLRSRATLALVAANTAGKVRRLRREQLEPPLSGPGFHGDAWRVSWPVLDVPSLLDALARPFADCIYQTAPGDTHIQTGDLHTTRAVFIRKGKIQLRLHPRQVILAAGAGNAALLADIGVTRPLLSRHPVHPVWIRHPDLPVFHAHAYRHGASPHLTITTHESDRGRAWCVTGAVAEAGGARDETMQVLAVRQELRELLPWLDLRGARFRGLLLERIRFRDAPPWRPARACVERFGNNWLVWPAWMTQAPEAGRHVLDGLAADGIGPGAPQPGPLPMARPVRGLPPWEKLLAG